MRVALEEIFIKNNPQVWSLATRGCLARTTPISLHFLCVRNNTKRISIVVPSLIFVFYLTGIGKGDVVEFKVNVFFFFPSVPT